MLEIKNIKKSYKTLSMTQKALDDISLKFKENEFVFILGPSGSGKTTFLNIVGGLDRADSGDLIIDGVSTKDFKDKDWDFYRNSSVGFIFQSYNLISHISVVDNVEMGMVLSGVKKNERRKKALELLDRVGLKDHAYKKPNELSGGQMQRVAIARALANDPSIILADEPTGALDSKTSVQIMELIKEIAKDKLVIMVTHNRELATKYADRVIEFKDGKVISDKDNNKGTKNNRNYVCKKTGMNFWTALKLSFNNIKTKKGRTILTAFASSIGIIGIALILALSNGFDIQIDNFEKDTLSSLPIWITQNAMNMDEDTMKQMYKDMNTGSDGAYTSDKNIYPVEPIDKDIVHSNVLTGDYLSYIEDIDDSLVAGISYNRATNLNIISKNGDNYRPLGLNFMDFINIPRKLDKEFDTSIIDDNYDLLYGKLPSKKEELLLIVDSNNRVGKNILDGLGIDSSKEKIDFSEILDKDLKLVLNDDYYIDSGNYFIPSTNLKKLYNSDNAITLKISGIVRGKEDKKVLLGSSYGLSYTSELIDYVISINSSSKIVNKQKKVNYNVLTGELFNNDEEGKTSKNNFLSYLGDNSMPSAISIFPIDFDAKNKISDYLDKYNTDKDIDDKIIYVDYGKTISSLSSNIMDAITIVLVAFSAISLIVSCIMIGIITYISVLERTKEIGVLRALGARKIDVKRVFNAETFIVGISSGIIGIVIARLLVFPTNIILKNLTGLSNVAKMNPLHAIILIAVSVLLTIIGGAIPAGMASKKDPVVALRTE